MRAIFAYLSWSFVCLLLRSVYSDSLPTFKWSYLLFGIELSSLYISIFIPLLHVWFANIFTSSIGSLHSTECFLDYEDGFYRFNSIYLTLLLLPVLLGSHSRNCCPDQCHEKIPSVFL
jgi:hypothetical protein